LKDWSGWISTTEQVAKLSETEMKETEGEFIGGGALIGAAFGAIGGVAAYGASVATNDHRSWNTTHAVGYGALGAASGGAIGAFNGATVAGSAFAAEVGAAAGAVRGEFNEHF
jgi:hypothetical protein